jgi:hypothetical protein
MLEEAKELNPNFTYQLSIDTNQKIDNPQRYRGFTQFTLWFLRPSIIRQTPNKMTKAEINPLFQQVVDSVELIHNSDVLADFWKNGKLVSTGTSLYNQNIPTNYQSIPREFLLKTDASGPVWAFALEKGEAPNREWLIYIQSPEENLSDITVTIPNYNNVNLNATQEGSFYTILENSGHHVLITINKKQLNTTINIPFQVYDATMYKNKPRTFNNINFPKINIIYNGFWKANESHEFPDLAQCKITALSLKQSQYPHVLDIEHWDVTDHDENISINNIKKYIAVIDEFKKIRPNQTFGFYGVIPNRDYWAPVSNDPEKIQEWDTLNKRLNILAKHVDYIFPSLYTFYDNEEEWEQYAIENLKKAKAYGKPVFAFLWPQYHQKGDSKLRGRYISQEFWQKQLEICHQYADGIIIWGGVDVFDSSNSKYSWDENAPWWQTTKQFILDNANIKPQLVEKTPIQYDVDYTPKNIFQSDTFYTIPNMGTNNIYPDLSTDKLIVLDKNTLQLQNTLDTNLTLPDAASQWIFEFQVYIPEDNTIRKLGKYTGDVNREGNYAITMRQDFISFNFGNTTSGSIFKDVRGMKTIKIIKTADHFKFYVDGGLVASYNSTFTHSGVNNSWILGGYRNWNGTVLDNNTPKIIGHFRFKFNE